MPYNPKVIEYYENPRNMGTIANADGVGLVGAPACGDVMKLTIKVAKDTEGNEIIEDARFKTFGCGAAIATSSMATEMIKGKRIEEAMRLTNRDVANALGGLPPVKMHCSVLAEEALKAAINDYRLKQSGNGKGDA
jgi:nitrogen fixation NifU-like protein